MWCVVVCDDGDDADYDDGDVNDDFFFLPDRCTNDTVNPLVH